MNTLTIAFSVIEMIQLVSEDIAKYKTNSSKKAFITRSANQQRTWINELKEAVNERDGWLFGVKYTRSDIHREQLILEGIKKLYTTIKL